jgi:hypothetical protein
MFLVHTNSDSAKREKVCHLHDSCTYDVVQREGVKFRDRGSKIERNIEKHQICHTLPERSVGTSLWRPKIFIMGTVFFARGQICPDLFVSVMFWQEPRAKSR